MGLLDVIGKVGGAGSNPAGMLLGAGQKIVGAVQRKQADALVPSVEDPMSRQYLNEIRRRRRATETGTANAADRAAMRQMAKSGLLKSMMAGSPVNTGYLASITSQAAQNLATGKGQALAQLLGLEGQQVSEMAQRKFDIGMYRSQVKSARAEQNVKSGNENLLASIGMSKQTGEDIYNV